MSAITGTPVKVRALRACTVTVGRTGIKPDAAVLFALALYLAMRAGEHVTRGEVIALLWPDGEDTSRRHALRQLLYRLKRAGMPVGGDGDELSLQLENVDCDLARLLTEGWAASVSLADLPAPRDVLPGYEPAVAQPFHEWIDGVRTRAAAAIRHAALRHIQSARLEGRWADVNRVARLCIEADPLNEEANLALAESIAMSGSKAEALRMLDSYFIELGDHGKTVGLSTQLLRRRISDQPAYRAPRPSDPPLIGREEDIAWLNSRLELTREKQTSTAMLAGPPGIGKTALMRAFASHAEMRGWRFVESRLQPSDVDSPMSVFVELLPTLMKASGALGAAPESIAQLRQLFEHGAADEILANKSQEAEAVQARIRTSMLDLVGAVAEEGPLVLVLEDLHWIDRQSLRLLSWLLDHSAKVPMMWLLTARLEGRFVELRETFAPDQVPVRMIDALDRPGSMDLFRACISESESKRGRPLPVHAYDITGGNPLFIREVAGHWAETGGSEALPNNLKAVMRGRVARLSASAQRLLHCCAVLGRFATVSRVSTVLGIGTSELLACIEEVDGLGLLGLGGEAASLALHDLWQEELAGTMTPPAQALLHLRAGEALATESDDSKSASMVSDAARHLIAAGVTDRALRLLEDAAAHQLANGLSEDAVRSLTQAIEISSTDDSLLRLEEGRIAALITIGGWQQVDHSIARAQALHRKLHQPDHEHTPLELVAIESTLLAQMALDDTISRARACVQSKLADDLHRATAARLGARAASNQGRADLLEFFAVQARSLDTRSADVRAQVLAVETVYHADAGSVDKAAEIAGELVATERTIGSVRGLIRSLRYSTMPLRLTGQYDRAIAAARESFECAIKHRIAEDAAAGADILATIHFEAADLATARTWLERAEPWIRRVTAEYARTSASITRAMVCLEAGDCEAAARTASTDLKVIEIDPMLRHKLFHLSIAARIFVGRTDFESLIECVPMLRDALNRARDVRRNEYFIASLALALTSLGDSSAAKAAISEYYAGPLNAGLTPWREFERFGWSRV